MADFFSASWSWYIGIVTIVSLLALFIFTWRLSASSRQRDGTPVETMGHVWDEDLEEYNNPMPRWWLNLFYITIVFGGIYLALYPGLGAFEGVLGWTQVGEYTQEVTAADDKYGPLFNQYLGKDLTELVSDSKALAIGARLFSTYCTGCHGSDAGGARGFPNLRDNDWLYGGEPAQIKTTIMDGRQGAMPAWGPILGRDAVSDVAAYVETLSGRKIDPQTTAGNPVEGEKIFQANCFACHGADGKGNPLLGAPNLTDDIWLYGGSPAKIVESIELGRNGVMPAHQEFLGEAKVQLLAAYIYSLRQHAMTTVRQ